VSERKKKYLIVFLLLGACIVSTFLLIHSSSIAVQSLNSLAEADSLLRKDLETFNISHRQIREHTIQLDSVRSRKEYRVRVPQGFSKTQLHHEIHTTFHRYDVITPARVEFPEKDYHIFLLKDKTVFTSIRIDTDPELELQRSFGSILVAFDSKPSENMLNRVQTIGEPISIVMMVEDPEEAGELASEWPGNFSNIFFWLQNRESGIETARQASLHLPKLQQLQENVPGASVLSFQSLVKGANNLELEDLSGTTLDFIDVSEATLLQADMGKTAFEQELNKFSRKARRGEYPIAIVIGEEESLNWLQEELADFKKRGLTIVPVKKKRF